MQERALLKLKNSAKVLSFCPNLVHEKVQHEKSLACILKTSYVLLTIDLKVDVAYHESGHIILCLIL